MAAPPLPDSTPQDFATYVDKYLNHGQPVPALNLPGASVGDQWLAWYAIELQKGLGGTLLQYEQAFIAEWEIAELSTNIAGAAGGGAAAIGTSVSGIAPGISQFNADLGGVPAAAANAYSAATSWMQQLGGFFGALGQKATWIRVAEVALGVLLLAFGLNKALGNPAGKAAGTVAKGAALL